MGHHTFDATKAGNLEDATSPYRHGSREELLWALDERFTAADSVTAPRDDGFEVEFRASRQEPFLVASVHA
ncbi:hypothetical protein [Haloarchaeobius sp. HRN-SO-5]|uniref:hypothetical protein n=1 Tax=Haloarchaeobius sp. HRN-SO-5 TaxID=3446118 RepID=UPI003EBF069A